jgi:hypothetical protein
MRVGLEDGKVWLTISDFDERDVVVHGVFTSEAYAKRCAKEVRKNYPTRKVYTGEWKMNEAWTYISDGHLS